MSEAAASRPPMRGREWYKVWRTLETRWADNDAYGHVNNVIYYGWFDTAVNAWLIETRLLNPGKGNPIGLVVETGCRYARALAFPAPVEVGLAMEYAGKSSVRYSLGVFAVGQDEAAAEGFFVHVYVDAATRQPVDLPEAWREALGAIGA